MADSGSVAADGAPRGDGSTAPRRAAWILAAIAVLALALAFRLLRFAEVPPGLYIDELLTARNALAWRLAATADWTGARPLLTPDFVETSNLYLAFASAAMWLGGDGLLGVRLISALPSLACVGLLFLLGRRLGGVRVGLLAAFLLACSHWAARSGRTGWDQVLMTALELAALVCLARVVTAREEEPRAETGWMHVAWAALAGALLGLSLYTYVAARLALLHALLWLGWEAIAARRDRRRAVALLLASGLAAVAVAAPFYLRLLAERPQQLALRARQLSVLGLDGPGEPWSTIAHSLGAHLLMFHLRGGAYARDALPGWPMLDPVTGLLLLAGLATVLARPGWRRRLLVSWPAVVVLGGVLSVSGEGPPYPYRVGNLAPWACLVAALGAARAWDVATARRLPGRRAITAIALALVVAINAWQLFVAGPAHPATRLVYGTTPTTVGRFLAALHDDRPVLVVGDALEHASSAGDFPFAAANDRDFFRPLDAIAAVQLAAGLYAHDPGRALDPLAFHGDIDLVDALPTRLGRPTLVVVRPDAAAAVAAAHPVSRRWLLRHRGVPLATVLAVER